MVVCDLCSSDQMDVLWVVGGSRAYCKECYEENVKPHINKG